MNVDFIIDAVLLVFVGFCLSFSYIVFLGLTFLYIRDVYNLIKNKCLDVSDEFEDCIYYWPEDKKSIIRNMRRGAVAIVFFTVLALSLQYIFNNFV